MVDCCALLLWERIPLEACLVNQYKLPDIAAFGKKSGYFPISAHVRKAKILLLYPVGCCYIVVLIS